MAYHDISSPKNFSTELRKVEVTDAVHADFVNPIYERLINNDAYLKDYIDDCIKKLINDSPEALDTLKELADALGNDANFSKTILDKVNSIKKELGGAGRTTETIKGVSDSVNTLKNSVDNLTVNIKSIQIVDNAPTSSQAEEGVLYLVKEGGN